MAFSRFFPGPEAISLLDSRSEASPAESKTLRTETRAFTRLTGLASWRSEYVLRTRLLRSLARGKPAEIQSSSGPASSRSASSQVGNAQITYNSNLITPVSHIHATFGAGLNKKFPLFIHGSDETGSASLSDPKIGKVEQWGFFDPQAFSQFIDRFPGDALYGLGAADIVGVPNSMDVSQAYGMVYGEGWPGGLAYYRSIEEKRGRSLAPFVDTSSLYIGAPSLPELDTICTVWIAKNHGIVHASDGLIGLLVGTSSGVISAYSSGSNNPHERRLERGELTARWALSPGVPIIAIAVDEDYSTKRQAQLRTWAVALNALGEVFYLSQFPSRPEALTRAMRLNDQQWEVLAWKTGRTVFWELVEPTRRTARVNPFDEAGVDGSYSPRTSWNNMGLSDEQIAAESREIQAFAEHKPNHFQKVCEGWDMQRRLLVDFAASDVDAAGEGIVVLECGLEGGSAAVVKRYTRCKTRESSKDVPKRVSLSPQPDVARHANNPSIFGGITSTDPGPTAWSFDAVYRARQDSDAGSDTSASSNVVEEWLTSTLSLAGLKSVQITATAIDTSTFAALTIFEDPLLAMSGSSAATSPNMSPLSRTPLPGSVPDTPGQRARLMAVGTKTGTVIIWNIRAPLPSSSSLDNVIAPIRIIYTDSPQISCLALSALYLVHGGNDGLVQAWDPLASTTEPIRTLNSRFSSRARRRLIQAEASPQGVGINLFAASALYLDPDPTSLRGMVSLGTHLRYWSYSSSAADQYKSNKRKLRRADRGSNQHTDRFSGTGRGALKEYIANEKHELEMEKRKKRKQQERLVGRFGVDLLGPEATEDEILAYATLLSEEAAASDELRRKSASSSESRETIVEEESMPAAESSTAISGDEADADIREAIRLSLQDSATTSGAESSQAFFPAGQTGFNPSLPSMPQESTAEIDDLELALRLSLEEERSQKQTSRLDDEGAEGKRRAH